MLLRPMSETTNLERLNKLKETKNGDDQDCKQSVRKEERGTLRELEGCKAMNDKYNGQEGIEITLVETR